MWTRFQTSHRILEVRIVPRDYPRGVLVAINNCPGIEGKRCFSKCEHSPTNSKET